MLEAIYHPYYIPDKNWYKTQLLLWDKIYRIVPSSVNDEFGKKKLADLWDIPEKHVLTKDIEMYDHKYFDERKKAITNQLKKLSKDKHKKYIENQHTYLNSAKIPKWVGETLKKYQLREKKLFKKWQAEHYLVREDASDFLMSCVAHRMSIYYGTSPLTDKKISCFTTFGNQIGKLGKEQPSGESMKSLIVSVFNILVPGDIEKLSFKDVLDIRTEYEALRQSATKFIKTIADEFTIEQVVDKKTAESLVKSASFKLEEEIDRFKKQTWKRIFQDWRTQSIATTLGTVASYIAGGPEIALALGSGSAFITIMNNITGKEESNAIDDTIQYFSMINRKIEINEFTEGLLNYRKFVLGIE